MGNRRRLYSSPEDADDCSPFFGRTFAPMNIRPPWFRSIILGCLGIVGSLPVAAAPAEIRTPPPPATPRINGPTVFGVRPNSPFFYTIPVTGERPIAYAVDNLPAGLSLDSSTGRISGRMTKAGEYPVVFRASNRLGQAEKKFRIVVGEKIALTPPLGWNSWNSWAGSVDQDKVLRSARALVSCGLANHGWTYVNIDDTWQGERGGKHFAILGNEKFPDMKKLCDDIHALGLKAGIYSSPWVTTYAGFRGGSSDDAQGNWPKVEGYDKYQANHRLGKYTFEKNDAAQWAEWGFDYLKYDWNPNDIPHTKAMAEALRATGRDIVFSLSNAAPFEDIAELSKYANAWRTTGDIVDAWAPPTAEWWQASVTEIGFNQDRWVPHGRPGHWNDPDMMEIGNGGMNDIEYRTHFSMWAMLAAPLIAGNDIANMSPATGEILMNREVIAVDQDELGVQGNRIWKEGNAEIWARPLQGGGRAVLLFNRGETPVDITVTWEQLHYPDNLSLRVRDLWGRRNVGRFRGAFSAPDVPPHGVMMIRIAS